jgi:mannose-6-phosphate isomerase-like protein (cupin superfamily)
VLLVGVAGSHSIVALRNHREERRTQARVAPERLTGEAAVSFSAMQAVSLNEKFALIHEHWRPKVIAQLNGQELKLVKFQGQFPWHRHEREDEMFLVWRGRMRIEFRDSSVELTPGELYVVPRGVEHRTCADEEAEVLVFEPEATRNTGDVVDARFTAPNGVEI